MAPKRNHETQRDPELRDATIQAGDDVLVQLQNGDIRSVKVDPDSFVSVSFKSSA